MVTVDQSNLNPHLSSGRAIVSNAAKFLVLLVAVVHVAIAVTEVFIWNNPLIHSRLGFTSAEATKVAPIVANAGLYNGFLAAGLIWGLLSATRSSQIKMFFLSCVILAGIFGAVTLKWTTLVLQSTPGTLALLAVWMSTLSVESDRSLTRATHSQGSSKRILT
jgi:putative membrane protein